MAQGKRSRVRGCVPRRRLAVLAIERGCNQRAIEPSTDDREPRSLEPDPGSDVHAVLENRIAVTPVHLDLTAPHLLEKLRLWGLES